MPGILTELGGLIAEGLYPTRCILCDEAGWLVCPDCLRRLEYIAWDRRCPVCGSPEGRTQCCDCAQRLERLRFERALEEPDGERRAEGRPSGPAGSHRASSPFPFDGCASAVCLDARAARIAVARKDAHLRALALPMAECMARIVPPAWMGKGRTALSFVPSSCSARARRGFDHAYDLAFSCARLLELPLVPLLALPSERDLRSLGGRARLGAVRGMEGLPAARAWETVIVADDIFTTGATLSAAAEALKAAGAGAVFGLTFARVR